MDPDLEVVEAVLRGETDHYGELVERYQLAAWKLAYGFVGNFEEAKDLSQNGFVKAFRGLRGFRRGAKFSTWLYRIIANECKDFLRSRGRQPDLVSLSSRDDPEGDDPLPFELPDPAGDPRDAAHQKELAARIFAALRELPMKQQTAFLLHRLNQMPLEEVSQVMGCRVGTVKSHLFRATEALRRRVEPLVTEEVPR